MVGAETIGAAGATGLCHVPGVWAPKTAKVSGVSVAEIDRSVATAAPTATATVSGCTHDDR